MNRLILVGGLLVLASSVEAAEGNGKPVVVDPLTGFAAAGFDPVAYFADGAARPGSTRFEASWGGTAWRFVNEGNRLAFLAHPEVYSPAFGGHCAVAVARGYMAEGDPTIWVLHDGRLYFFHSEANRQVFLLGPERAVAEAEAVWQSERR